MQIWAESGKSALPICNYSQILYQFLTFTQNLKRSPGVPYTVKEYEGGEHPFIHSPYPEFQKGLSAEEKAVFANEEQFALSYQAENDIKEWLNSLWA